MIRKVREHEWTELLSPVRMKPSQSVLRSVVFCCPIFQTIMLYIFIDSTYSAPWQPLSVTFSMSAKHWSFLWSRRKPGNFISFFFYFVFLPEVKRDGGDLSGPKNNQCRKPKGVAYWVQCCHYCCHLCVSGTIHLVRNLWVICHLQRIFLFSSWDTRFSVKKKTVNNCFCGFPPAILGPAKLS